MASIAENKFYYDHFDWRYTGEYWGNRWGGTEMQWHGAILPRIHPFLPAATILEIGPGRGRLARLLEAHCDRLLLADFCEACVEGCRKRFRGNDKVEAVLTDGQSLTPVADGSVDFVFSFFSLVHADEETMRGTLFDIARVLTPVGNCFLHHSNAGACLTGDTAKDTDLDTYRDASVDASVVAALAREAGLYVRTQELLSWDDDAPLTDCFSTLTRLPPTPGKRPNVLENKGFPGDVKRLRELALAYRA